MSKSKKVIIVSKTHLDLGFTDYAANIKSIYLNKFIPQAIAIAHEVNQPQQPKRFTWTCGSWLIREALNVADMAAAGRVREALINGDIVPHAMPFTTHTELLDSETLQYGLNIVGELDAIRGRRTLSAKMTDVPGHTIALVQYLAAKGIRLLHIGVNGASALAKVPPCFLWKSGAAEVVVIYSGDYGGEFRCDYISDILYFDHTLDNRGTPSAEAILAKYNAVAAKYPDYDVVAGCMDDIAVQLWSVRDRLPVVTAEMGDSWIHGVATDPYKVACMKELATLRNHWISAGSLRRTDKEYLDITDNLLCIAEHTWGMDMKCHFADYENYLRCDFDRARQRDKVRVRRIFRDFPHNFLNYFAQLLRINERGSYKAIEASWTEQRNYIQLALNAMTNTHRAQAEKALQRLLPTELERINSGQAVQLDKSYIVGNYDIKFNRFGGYELSYCGEKVMISQDFAPLVYQSYGQSDYHYWLENYTRDWEKTHLWALGDFARPLYGYADPKFQKGKVNYVVSSSEMAVNGDKFIFNYGINEYYTDSLGAPRDMQITYSLTEIGLKIAVNWLNKSANRITESLAYRMFPNADANTLRYTKIGVDVNPLDVIEGSNRKLACAEKITFSSGGRYQATIVNTHSPLVSLGCGDILRFDNLYADIAIEGISFVLHDNIWGTNFPLWYEDNGHFEYQISAESVEEK